MYVDYAINCEKIREKTPFTEAEGLFQTMPVSYEFHTPVEIRQLK